MLSHASLGDGLLPGSKAWRITMVLADIRRNRNESRPHAGACTVEHEQAHYAALTNAEHPG
jgi:hypothetical protein